MGIELIESIITPVVMISANGLIYMALNNRLAFVTSRVRAFHEERFTIFEHYQDKKEPLREEVSSRFEGVHLQAEALLHRANLLRVSLLFNLGCSASMLFCSLAIGLSFFGQPFVVLAISLFILGILMALPSILIAAVEMRNSLNEASLEHARLSECKFN